MQFLFFAFSFFFLFQCQAKFVTQLNAKNFDTYVLSGTWFVQFYTPWCGVCKKSLVVWQNLAERMREENPHINFGTINGDACPKLVLRLGVQQYPAFLLFEHGGTGTYLKYNNTEPEVREKKLEHFIFAYTHKRPEQDREHITLRYFKSRGRAEIIRLTLEASGLTYDQALHSSEEWPAIKEAGIASGTLPFGQVPAIRIDHRDLVQSAAIVRYIGAKHNLIPHEYQTEVEILMGGVEDLYKRYSGLIYSEDFTSKKDEYVNNVLPIWLEHFERYLGKTASSYLVGNVLTVADLCLFNVVTVNLAMSVDCLRDFPLLEKHVKTISTYEPIKHYLLSDRRLSNQNDPSAHFDTPEQPSPYWDILKSSL